jgi:hypothetical protein
MPIILTFRQASGVSLSPRSGRYDRSEWTTVRRTVDGRGGAAPFNTSQPKPSAERQRPTPEQAFRSPG